MQEWAGWQHADGRWVALCWMNKRVDRTEGGGGQPGAHTYELFALPSRARAAFARGGKALLARGFRHVEKIRGFVNVPVEQWLEVGEAPKGKAKPEDARAATAGRKARARTFARAKTRPLTPRPFARSGGALVSDVHGRVEALGRQAGVAMRPRFNRPATAAALVAAEKKLVRALPTSLRAVLALHDGLRIAWTSKDRPWRADLEILPLREMLMEWRRAKSDLTLGGGEIVLPIFPRVDRWVVGVAIGEKKKEACVVELLDPPDGRVLVLAPSFGAFLAKAVANCFVIAGRSDVEEDTLPAIRRTFARVR